MLKVPASGREGGWTQTHILLLTRLGPIRFRTRGSYCVHKQTELTKHGLHLMRLYELPQISEWKQIIQLEYSSMQQLRHLFLPHGIYLPGSGLKLTQWVHLFSFIPISQNI